MSITGLNHITINVTDLEASRAFYEGVLGLIPSNFVDMGDHRLTYYQLPQNVCLELIEYDNPGEIRHYGIFERGIYRHFCLETDDLEAVYQACLAHGIQITQAPGYVEKLQFSNILLIDPNGVELEIIQK